MAVSKGKDTVTEGRIALSDSLDAVIVSEISALKREEWEQCVPNGNFFLSYDYLNVFERTSVPGIGFFYVQVFKNNQPFAVFYFQRLHLSVEELGQILSPLTSTVKGPSFIGHLSEWLKKTKEEKGFRLLVSGNNFISGEYGVGLSPGADSAEAFDAMAAAVKWITKKDRVPSKISAILVKDYFSSGKNIPSDRLKKKRYHRFLVEPELIVTIDPSWNSFEDYLGAMSKKYRNRLKSVMKKSARLEITELDAEAVRSLEPELHQLYLNVHERAKFRLAALGENYFSEMKSNFPESFCLVAYRCEGKLIGFRSSFRAENHLEAHFIGINYDYNPEHCLYQRILYDFVAEGMKKGASQVYLGRTAAEIKSTVGAVAHDLVCYIRHRNGLSNQVIRPFIDYLKPSVWIPRNPFKDNGGDE